jgi:hypothetical protein
MRLVFECPYQPNIVTCVKVKGFFRFQGFESLFGANLEEDLDVLDTLTKAYFGENLSVEESPVIKAKHSILHRSQAKGLKKANVRGTGFEDRTLCSDETCIGIKGPDGPCTECGEPIK